MSSVHYYPFFNASRCIQVCQIIGNVLPLLGMKEFSEAEPVGAIIFVNRSIAIFEEAIVWDQIFGQAKSHTPFKDFARRKAELSYNSGLPSRIATTVPSLLTVGDTYYPGSWIVENVIVAFSGIEGELDEVLAQLAVNLLLAKGRIDLKEKINKGGGVIK